MPYQAVRLESAEKTLENYCQDTVFKGIFVLMEGREEIGLLKKTEYF